MDKKPIVTCSPFINLFYIYFYYELNIGQIIFLSSFFNLVLWSIFSVLWFLFIQSSGFDCPTLSPWELVITAQTVTHLRNFLWAQSSETYFSLKATFNFAKNKTWKFSRRKYSKKKNYVKKDHFRFLTKKNLSQLSK